MVIIRLSRVGAKHRPFYHIVVTNSRKSRDGACIEKVGYFNPMSSKREVSLSIYLDRVNYWFSVGAKVSDKVKYLLKKY